MIFKRYSIENTDAKLANELIAATRNSNGYNSRSLISSFNQALEDDCAQQKDRFCAIIYDFDKTSLQVIAAFREDQVDEEQLNRVLKERFGVRRFLREEEVTLDTFCEIVDRAENHGYTANKGSRYWQIKFCLDVHPRYSFYGDAAYKYTNTIAELEPVSKKECMDLADKIMASKSLKDEITRIYSKENERRFVGNPVHYYITAGSWGAAEDIIRVLLLALNQNKRMQSRRVAYLRKLQSDAYREDRFSNVFEASSGATLVLDLSGERGFGNYASSYVKTLEVIGKRFAMYGNKTLYIFVEINGELECKDETLAAILGNGDIVKIDEGFGNYPRALRYLERLADESDFAPYKEEDMGKYLPDKISYTVSDVYDAFNEWYGKGLKTHIYKAYKTFERVKIEPSKTVNNPYEKLQELVGLSEIKQTVDSILSFAKIQAVRKTMGLDDSSSSRHMVFYGNPGTAKTTVARLLAQILKEEGVLENGHLVEVGRQDLVARYVGWTAKTVREKFEAARGGILFIDEAYSLTDDRNSFGREATNTIVQLMENYRDEVIVILAGYPEPMRKYVGENEGLLSRIAFHLNFPDYNEDELTQILELMLKERQYTMSDEAKARCTQLFREACCVKDFGNGRYVRNLLERTAMNQSQRIATQYKNLEVDKAQVAAIEVEDIPKSVQLISETKTPTIGYIA